MNQTLEDLGYPSDPGHDHQWSPWKLTDLGVMTKCSVCSVHIIGLHDMDLDEPLPSVRMPVTKHHVRVVD